jgi:hypothetical protein
MTARCEHLWAEFCHGVWGGYPTRPYWRVLICVRCYAKREVAP